MTARYAIYFAPAPESDLHRLGSAWLGRDAFTGFEVTQPALPGLDNLTAEPRRYGFHATLKAPFALADGISLEDLSKAVQELCSAQTCFPVSMEVSRLHGFLALVPDSGVGMLAGLASRCVSALDRFRRPPSDSELIRRRSAGLTPEQDAYLLRWGYPYVMEQFRFHMTLSRRLSDAESDVLMPLARSHFESALSSPVTVGGVTLFEEPSPGSPFRAIRQFALSAPALEVQP